MATTKTELRELAERLSRATGRDITVNWAYGVPCLHENNESKNLSPHLLSGQLADYMRAMLIGVEFGKEILPHRQACKHPRV